MIEQAKASGDNSAIEVEVDKVIATKDKDTIQELGAKLAESGIEEYTLAGSKSYEEVQALMTGQNMGAFENPIATFGEYVCLVFNDTRFSYNMMSLEMGVDESDCFGLFADSNVSYFDSDIPSLTDGHIMFLRCSNLASFTSDLPNLTKGYEMFGVCSNLTSFTSELPKLTDGTWMFGVCSNLTSFTSELPKLTDGTNMFYGCKIDLVSVQNIARTINTYNGYLSLGLGCTRSTFDDHSTGWYDAVKAIEDKGWTVAVGCNG